MRALALMPALWIVAWLMLDGGAYWLDATAAFVVMTVALAIFGIGECFHGPAHQALVAEIAPDHLRGRYFAVHSLSWGLAGTVGPAAGGFLLAAAPFALWPLRPRPSASSRWWALCCSSGACPSAIAGSREPSENLPVLASRRRWSRERFGLEWRTCR